MFQMINFPLDETVQIDPEVWKACAGRSSRTSFYKQVPEVGTDVYYFPEGHAEQYELHLNLAVAPFDRPMVPCRVLDVRYFADRTNDDLFAAIVLQPPSASSPPVVFGGGAQRPEGLDIDWETKVLTQSDANGACGLTVPKECAESILPLLELDQEHLPSQNLTMSDVQGRKWEFRHVYQGKPARHVLAAYGWNNFSNTKLLVAGDTVVLMKDRLNEELYIGVRRRRPHMDHIRRRFLHLGAGDQEGVGNFQRFVEDAARRAAQGLRFEVVLYPMISGFKDFVLQTRLVDTTLRLRWAAGVRVKMNLAAFDCPKPRWIDGRVSDVMIPQEDGQWRGSPWKMLQITWDQPEPDQLPQNVESLISPWEVENLENEAFLLG
ncbi:unnamed protein product [Rhodiola kirilowii]